MNNDFSGKYLESDFVVQFFVRDFFKTISKMLAQIECEKILEVGAGSGFSTQYLKNILRGKNFEASEYREDLVIKARGNNLEVKIQQESIYELKRENGFFDLVIALEVLEHLQYPEIGLKEISRTTSKYCLISVPNEPLWRFLNVSRLKYLKNFGNTPGHLQHWSKSGFKEFAEKYFKVEKIETSLPWLIILGKKTNA